MSATTTPTTPEYFNLHVSGIGYLNRVRWVEPSRSAGRRAQAFLACSISALRGRPEDREHTYFDVRVSGAEAQGLIASLMTDVGANRKVVVGFRIGDIYPHLYEREVRDPQSGRKTGQREWATLIKGRLLLVNSITVDGERIFTRTRDDEVEPAEHTPDGPDSPRPDHPAPTVSVQDLEDADALVEVTEPAPPAARRPPQRHPSQPARANQPSQGASARRNWAA